MKLLLTTIDNNCTNTKLALRYLYSVVADAPVDAEYIEYDEKELNEKIYRDIIIGRYNLVYFHCNSLNVFRIATLCELVKKAVPSAVIIVGGMEVTFNTRDFMLQNPSVDYVIRGEGEKTLVGFLKTILRYDFDFEGIPGLAYRNGNRIFVNPLADPVEMEELPFPYEKTFIRNADVVYYETIRGTADRCAYAQYLPDPRIRSLSLNRICTELRYFLAKSVSKVIVTDKWFNYNTERAYRIFEYLINNDNGSTSFYFDINGDWLDEETIRLLGEARRGLINFSVDIESTNAESLAAVGRRENVYQMMYNIEKLLQKKTVAVNVNLRAGLPYETEEQFARSFNKIYGLGADTFNVNCMLVERGTALRQAAAKFGYRYNSMPPYEVIATDHMPADAFIRIKEVVKVAGMYAGNGGFEQSIPRMMLDTGLKPYDLYRKLAEYIHNGRLMDKTQSVENLYRILYGFAVGLYDELNDTLKLQILMDILKDDLENSVDKETAGKFDRKGWEIDA